jgi:CRISPR/Cas system type I-B associated protein Csh2 (Cas7 group RAMP superfamily)
MAENKNSSHFATGVVQFGSGVSLAPVEVYLATETNKAGVEADKDRGMAPLGHKVINHGVYILPFYINALQAPKTKCSVEDLNVFKEVLPYAYSLNLAKARTSVYLRHIWWVEHKSALGSCPDHEIIDALTPKLATENPVCWSDYKDSEGLPEHISARVKSCTDLTKENVPASENRVTGLLIIEVRMSNPNGDPDRDGEPRTLGDYGVISGVSVKAKIRQLVGDEEFWKHSNYKPKYAKLHILEQRGRDRKEISGLSDDEFLKRFWDARVFGATFLEAESRLEQDSGSARTRSARKENITETKELVHA